MFSDVHTMFIITPLTDVLLDGVNACTPMPVGIENSALGEYFMQSLFLKLTGAQEQESGGQELLYKPLDTIYPLRSRYLSVA